MKRGDESYLEYKKRVIDPISNSFCGAKWYNATVWLGHGATTSCHHPPAHKVPLEELKDNPKALHNTIHKKAMRYLMLQGKRPPECEYCWKIEDMKRDNISDRVFKTVIYEDEDLKKAAETPVAEDINIKTLEIAFERTCNFACSYCNAGFSSRWGQDIKQNGPYQNLVTDGGGAYQHDGHWAEPYKKGTPNPYVEAFWEWWPELSKSLKELRITGGEPLMSDDVWRLFDYFKKHGSGSVSFAVNSNLGGKDELIDRLIEGSHYINDFHLYSSLEAVGAQAEYIRDGLEYDRYIKNLRKICKHGNAKSVNIMMTINSLCLFSITEFLDTMMEIKSEFGRFYPVWSVNILRFPSFMSPLFIPEDILEKRRQNLAKWLAKNESSPLMHEMERDSLKRLVDYLEVVKSPHRRTSKDVEKLHLDFKSFYTQYDKRRNKDFRKTFPKDLVEWFDSIPLQNLGYNQPLIEGDATKGFHDYQFVHDTAVKAGLIRK